MRSTRRRMTRRRPALQPGGAGSGFRRLAAALSAVLVLAAALLVGCGSAQVTPTTAPATPSSSESTTTTAAVSTTLAAGTTATAAASSTTAAGKSSTTTTEKLSSAETRLADGHIKGMGYIDRVWEADGTRYISIDYAEMLTGQEAVDAAVKAGVIKAGESLDDDYFIRNDNPLKREFAVSPTATFTSVTMGEGTDGVGMSWNVFKSLWTEFAPEGSEYLHKMPWWIERDGKTVVNITEQYLP